MSFTKEDVAGKILAQILEMFESKIDRVIAMILTLPKAFLSLLELDRSFQQLLSRRVNKRYFDSTVTIDSVTSRPAYL